MSNHKSISAPLTALFGQFIAELDSRTVPAQALAVANLGWVDCLGVMLAARKVKEVQLLAKVCRPSSIGASLELAHLTNIAAPQAALINGTAAHAYDFDDIGMGTHPAHPSAVLVPTLLALGPAQKSSGREVLTSYIAGYEIWAECARREKDQHFLKGWHATGVFGSLAAAAAAAKLLQLEAPKAQHALAIAASQAAGLVSNFGTMTKPLHAGLAAQRGVLAAQLAAVGYEGAPDALESQHGFLQAFSPMGRVDCQQIPHLGNEWSICTPSASLGIKKYPVCYALHRLVDAAIWLHNELNLSSQEPDFINQIAAIHVTIGSRQKALLPFTKPKTSQEAKFSIQFCVAVGLWQGALRLSDLQRNLFRNNTINRLMNKIVVHTCSAIDSEQPTFSPKDRLLIVLKNGYTHEKNVTHATGHPQNPISISEIKRKFLDCLDQSYSSTQAQRIYDVACELTDQKSLDLLISQLVQIKD